MSVLTGEYFVPQIAQITRMEVRKRRVLWGNSNCHQLDSN